MHRGPRQGWAGGWWGLRFSRFMEISRRGGGSTKQPQRTEPCHCVSGQPWAFHGALQYQIQYLQCAAGMVGPVLGAAAGLGRWFVGVVVLPVCGGIQRRRHHSATSARRALSVCWGPALGMPWRTARSNAAFTLVSRCGGDCSGCSGRARRVQIQEEEAAFGNHSEQSPASV